MSPPRVFGDVVRAARHKAGMTQGDLAGLVEVDVRTILRVENGHSVALRTAVTIARTLDLPGSALLLGVAHGR